MEVRKEGWKGGRKDGRKEGRMAGWLSMCVYVYEGLV